MYFSKYYLEVRDLIPKSSIKKYNEKSGGMVTVLIEIDDVTLYWKNFSVIEIDVDYIIWKRNDIIQFQILFLMLAALSGYDLGILIVIYI